MDTAALIIVIIVLIPLLYLFYFWANSDVLKDIEVQELAESQRFWDIINYLSLNSATSQVNKEFKSALNKSGQFYNCDETLSNFPGIAAALLKGKKHEWVIFAFAKNKKVFSFYANKGFDNQSVGLNIDSEYFTKLAKNYSAEFVLQFHNHPNAVLASSPQDITSANYFGELFTNNSINYLAFVCGTGRYYQYGWWFTESFYKADKYLDNILKTNGISRSKNFELRKELRRKKYSKNFRLNNSSHNIHSQMKNEMSQS